MRQIAKRASIVFSSCCMVFAVCFGLVSCSGDETSAVNEPSITPQTIETSSEGQDGDVLADANSSAGTSNVNLSTLRNIEASHVLCVVEYMGNSVSFFDANTGKALGSLDVGVNPACLTATSDGSAVYVANSGNGQIVRLGIGDEAELTTMRAGTRPMSLALDEGAGRLYVSDYHLNSIRVVDTTLMSLVDVLELEPLGFDAREYAPSCCKDPLDGTVIDGRRPVSLSLSPDNAILYCGNIGTYDVSRIDLAVGTEQEPVDGVIGFRDVVVSPDGQYLLIAGVGSDLVESNDLIVERADTGEIVALVPVGADVSGVAWSGDRIVAIAQGTGELSCIMPETWKTEWQMQLDQGITDVAFSKDGVIAYVSNSDMGVVSAIDIDSQQVLWTAEGLADPRFLTVMS